jgi:glycosyltransferase involved in cell wall biosynthesis
LITSLLTSVNDHDAVVVATSRSDVDESSIATLVDGLQQPLAATASPIPVSISSDGTAGLFHYRTHIELPPPPTLTAPDAQIMAIDVSALSLLDLSQLAYMSTETALDWISTALNSLGFRHLAVPGLAHDVRRGPLSEQSSGALSAHQRWARSQLTGSRLAIDGACLSAEANNGTQLLVTNIAKAMSAARPSATVELAVPARHVAAVRRAMAGTGVHVGRRRRSPRADVVYRPYQSIRPDEVRWLLRAAPQLVVGQLDMIGFSNRSYHPSAALFATVRNLQRHMMQRADAVVFLSEFGRQTALAETGPLACTEVVGCGVDISGPEHVDRQRSPAGEHIVCLSSALRHKNRTLAIRVFVDLCERYSYGGRLILAGPNPYYGTSSTDDRRLVDSLPASIRTRIEFRGVVTDGEKWSLLAHADLAIYPSVVEGFGLVPFEAARCGTPTIAFLGSALGELLAPCTALVESWNVDDWSAAANTLMVDPSARADVLARIDAVAAAHTWSAVAARTWDVIDTITARGPVGGGVAEGGRWSSVARPRSTLDRTTGARHFVSRLTALATRRATQARSGLSRR